MSRIDYFLIEEKIKQQLEADDELNTDVSEILIEEELTFQRGKIIGIYLDRRDAAPENQTLSFATRIRFELRFNIWVFAWHLEVREAIHLRDDLLGKVELVLMADRSLQGSVTSSWISGGEFDNGQDGGGFYSGASIELIADKTAVV